jgi:hypothetical protein
MRYSLTSHTDDYGEVPSLPAPPRFKQVSCQQCGRELGPGNHGYNQCSEHTEAPCPTHATF